MITKRDEQALSFICNLQVATTSQINEHAYQNMRVCQRRLSSMTSSGVIFRTKNLYSKEYLYSCSKNINPKQLKHKLIRTQFYLDLCKLADVTQFLVEPKLGNLRPDAIVACKDKKTHKGLFFALEVEISNNRINTIKYDTFLDKHYDSIFKAGKDRFKVVYVTHRNLPIVDFKAIKISSELSDLNKLFINL